MSEKKERNWKTINIGRTRDTRTCHERWINKCGRDIKKGVAMGRGRNNCFTQRITIFMGQQTVGNEAIGTVGTQHPKMWSVGSDPIDVGR